MPDEKIKDAEDVRIKHSIRYRINISISTKGQKTWECTVDGEGFEMADVLERSDLLVAELDKRYPALLDGRYPATTKE